MRIVEGGGAVFSFEFEEDVGAACVWGRSEGREGREGGGEIALSSKGKDRTSLRPSALLVHISLTHANIPFSFPAYPTLPHFSSAPPHLGAS